MFDLLKQKREADIQLTTTSDKDSFSYLRTFSPMLLEANIKATSTTSPKHIKMNKVNIIWKLPIYSKICPKIIGVTMAPKLVPKKNNPVIPPVIFKWDPARAINVGNTDDKAIPNPAEQIHTIIGFTG